MTAEKNPAGGEASGVEIQNQNGDQIVNETTGTITAWVERGPEGKLGPLWEVAVERMTENEPWSIYATFEGYHDGDVDFAEMQRCIIAGIRAKQELARLNGGVAGE